MCLSRIQDVSKADAPVLGKNIQGVMVEDGKLVLTDILGRQTVLEGQIKYIDLINNVIAVSCP